MSDNNAQNNDANDVVGRSRARIDRYRRTKRILVLISGVVAAVAAVTTIVSFYQSQNKGPTLFDNDLTSSAPSFVDFLKKNDGRVVAIHIQCGALDANGQWGKYQNQNSLCLEKDQGDDSTDLLFVLTNGSISAPQYFLTGGTEKFDTQSAWIHVKAPPGAGASVYNGAKGAGWIEVKGYFAVTGMTFGDAPPGSMDYEIRAVRTEDALGR